MLPQVFGSAFKSSCFETCLPDPGLELFHAYVNNDNDMFDKDNDNNDNDHDNDNHNTNNNNNDNGRLLPILAFSNSSRP